MPAAGPVSVTICFALEWKRQLPHAPSRVWRAITKASEISRWMGYPTRLEQRVGGRFVVDFSPDGGSLEGVVVEWEPERALMCTGYGLTGDRTLLRWEVASFDGGTLLTFSQRGLSRAFAVGGGAGWEEFLMQLDGYLDGRPLDPAAERIAVHRALQPEYERRVEQALATKRGSAAGI